MILLIQPNYLPSFMEIYVPFLLLYSAINQDAIPISLLQNSLEFLYHSMQISSRDPDV
jgi:hypothetical protein